MRKRSSPVETMDRLKTSPHIHDGDTIAAIKAGGPLAEKAMMGLYAAYQADIKSWMHHLMDKYPGSKCEPADITHDSFIVVLHKIRHTDTVIPNMMWFWLGIAKNILFNQIKKNARISLVEDCTEFYGLHDNTQESIILKHEDDQHLENCLKRCGGRCYEILMMWVNKYPMQEIADRVNLSGPAMARKKKHECLKKLKELLENGNTLHASIHIDRHGAGGRSKRSEDPALDPDKATGEHGENGHRA